ncbi:MAG TPA: hypothetical protein VMJ92_05645, partial [Candidatus Limnocylindrales bacterium]|nr:hypothetical protein [Candidatus Limnocylindrales bacterium]
MRRSPRVLIVLVAIAVMVGSSVPAQADPGGVHRFVTLPDGPGHPEGIAADADGNIYVATFEFPPAPNRIYVFGHNGRLKATKDISYSPLGMIVSGGSLWVADFGSGDAVRYALPLTAASAEAARIDVCGGAGAGCALNAFAVDASGDLYVSDSFGGRIFKIDLPAGAVTTFFTHALLQPGSQAFPPFGANGLAFNAGFSALFIANTGDDRILRLAIVGGAPGALTTFAESVNGADGILFDPQGRLWVAANQNDELVALNANGRVVARRGSFEGIGRDGAPRGLLFPAS